MREKERERRKREPFREEDECDGDTFRDVVESHRQSNEQSLSPGCEKEKRRKRKIQFFLLETATNENITPSPSSSRSPSQCTSHQDVTSTKGEANGNALRHRM